MITESFENATLNVLIKKTHFDNLINSIKSFEDACRILKIEPAVPDVSSFLEERRLSVLAQHKLEIIIKALNEGWKPNWNDNTQYKYYNWFNMNAGTFSSSGTDYNITYANVPSALCFKNRELAEYAGRTFINLYKDYLT